MMIIRDYIVAHDTSKLGVRRMSDVSTIGDISMLHTPRNIDESTRGGFFDAGIIQ